MMSGRLRMFLIVSDALFSRLANAMRRERRVATSGSLTVSKNRSMLNDATVNWSAAAGGTGPSRDACQDRHRDVLLDGAGRTDQSPYLRHRGGRGAREDEEPLGCRRVRVLASRLGLQEEPVELARGYHAFDADRRAREGRRGPAALNVMRQVDDDRRGHGERAALRCRSPLEVGRRDAEPMGVARGCQERVDLEARRELVVVRRRVWRDAVVIQRLGGRAANGREIGRHLEARAGRVRARGHRHRQDDRCGLADFRREGRHCETGSRRSGADGKGRGGVAGSGGLPP